MSYIEPLLEVSGLSTAFSHRSECADDQQLPRTPPCMLSSLSLVKQKGMNREGNQGSDNDDRVGHKLNEQQMLCFELFRFNKPNLQG